MHKLINYTPYLYLHFMFKLFILFIFYSIYFFYSIFYSTFLSFLFFLTHCVSLFVDKRVVLSLLLHNLTFSCRRSQDDDPVRDCIIHQIKVYAYNNNNNNNSNNNNNNNNSNSNNNPCGSEILGWRLVGDNRVSWVGRTLKP